MEKDKPDSGSPEDLRRPAEKLFTKKKTRTLRKRTAEDDSSMAYELQVYQTQLEMQNE